MGIEHIRRETDLFDASGSDGQVYKIVEFTHFLLLRRFDGDPDPTTIEGRKDLYTWPDGQTISISGDVMGIPASGICLRRLEQPK